MKAISPKVGAINVGNVVEMHPGILNLNSALSDRNDLVDLSKNNSLG